MYLCWYLTLNAELSLLQHAHVSFCEHMVLCTLIQYRMHAHILVTVAAAYTTSVLKE
jgi:hypothetical protein